MRAWKNDRNLHGKHHNIHPNKYTLSGYWSGSIDLQKAFDTVNVDILHIKLESFGIGRVEHQWFQNYLSGRSHWNHYLIPDAVRGRYWAIRYSWNMPVWNFFFLADLSCADLFSIVSMLLCSCCVLCNCQKCMTSQHTLWRHHLTFYTIYEWMTQWYILLLHCFNCYFPLSLEL